MIFFVPAGNNHFDVRPGQIKPEYIAWKAKKRSPLGEKWMERCV